MNLKLLIMNTLLKRKRAVTTQHFLFITALLFVSISSYSQGTLLRGEKWEKFSVEEKKADFYVAPSGNDSWSGTLAVANGTNDDGPFRTIERAKLAVRKLKKEIYAPEEVPIDRRYVGSPHELGEGRDILVLIRDGYYSLEKPLHFTPEDAGERVETNLPSGAFEYHKLKDYYVTFAAYPGEKPIISGGQQLSVWKKKGKLWVANAENIDVTKLVVAGEGQTLARTPNSGFFTVPTASKSTSSFSFNPGEIKKWPNMEDNRIKMYLRWHHGINNISKVDERNNTAYLKKPQDGIIVISPRYYIENVKALLDAPGEWYFDKKSKKVSLLAPKSIKDPNTVLTAVPVLDNLIAIEGNQKRPVRNLRFYGLSFEGTVGDSSAISVKYANKCELVDSKINAVGGRGIDIGLGTFQMRILNNTIVWAEEGAIRVVGDSYPAHWSDIIREVTISENYIENCGRTTIHASNALYTTISHNEISNNLGRYPIYVGGWHNLEEAMDGGYTVEYNHIHHVQSLADDSGVITSGGYTYNSVIRKNLIHHVKKGEFNDNVALWFDNMSYGWTAEDNIYYDLEQGEMKLCAANLVDNQYLANYKIDAPEIEPKGIIMGEPNFEYATLEIGRDQSTIESKFVTGEFINARTTITNNGATGIKDVALKIDGIAVETKRIPIIADNKVQVSFEYLLSRPGSQRVSIGTTSESLITVVGKPLSFFYDALDVSSNVIPEGDEITITARVKRVLKGETETTARLYAGNAEVASQQIGFGDSDYQDIVFKYVPKAGEYKIRIGNSASKVIVVYPQRSVDIGNAEFAQYGSARAEPYNIDIDQKNNIFKIKAGGIDFYHGEDSYAAAYLKNLIKGNFVATVKLTGFGERTNEWFRSGLFVRNDMEKSFGTGMGSKGSVLMFATPGRAGINYDEYGDGCMHKANSENHPVKDTYPIWIKLVRHGNSFSGYVSYDGENWQVDRHTNDLPGLNEAVHLGLAAGSPDQLPYTVEFADFQLSVEEE